MSHGQKQPADNLSCYRRSVVVGHETMVSANKTAWHERESNRRCKADVTMASTVNHVCGTTRGSGTDHPGIWHTPPAPPPYFMGLSSATCLDERQHRARGQVMTYINHDAQFAGGRGANRFVLEAKP